MSERLSELADHIAQGLPDAKLDSTIAFGELTVVCKADDLKALLNFLRDDPQCRFVCLIDICGVDYPSRPRRFEIVYHLLSPYRNARIREARDHRRGAGAERSGDLSGGQLVRARGLRPLWRAVLRPPGLPPHPDRLRLPATPCARTSR